MRFPIWGAKPKPSAALKSQQGVRDFSALLHFGSFRLQFPSMPTFRMTVAYDGGAYAGWQMQVGQTSIQETLEAALAKVTGQSIRMVGSGRTDSGVHALGQVASFDSDTNLEPATLMRALNSELPGDIAVLSVALAPDRFHAQRWAKRKRYRYVLHDGRASDVFQRHYCWHIYRRLAAERMHQAAQALVGRHDFTSFQTGGAARKSTIRAVFELTVARVSTDVIHVEIEADGFLYNMVRAITGTLVRVGRGSKPVDWPAQVLAAQHRGAAGRTAPPQGLFLVRVEYE